MDSQPNRRALRGASSQKANSQELAGNHIRTCIEFNLDNESYAKFQQVLEYLSERLYNPLYKTYNNNLIAQLKVPEIQSHTPESGFIGNYIQLKVKFYSFRFISNVGHFILQKFRDGDGDEKAEEHFLRLIKILLFHGLTSKADTASLALVELEQLCKARQITLQSLYFGYRAKFLRLIIKAILCKLMNNNGDTYDPQSGNSSSSGNGSNWSGKTNIVIIYMTRALEIFNVISITKEDVAQSLIIVTNLIHKEKYNGAIRQFLDGLARYQNIDIFTLLRSHIQAIMVSLLLRKKLSPFDMTASLGKLCSFCDKKVGDMLQTKFTFIKGRLILHYSIDPKSVTDGVYYLSKFEKEECDQPFEDELDDPKNFIDYINPSMIGILLGIDSHFTSTRKDFGSEESIKHVQGLCKLLSILNSEQVQTIHVKLLSTLSLLLRLRPKRDNQDLNKALRDLWKVFVDKLSRESKISLLINICVALYDLIEDCPEEVAGIYEDLICKENPKAMSNKLRSLFFIPNIPPMSKIYSYLTPYVRRNNAVSNLQDLQRSLDCVLPLMKFENHKCRLIALVKIKQLLKSNQDLLIFNMLINPDEPIDNLISKTIESLIALSSIQDTECSVLIADCLGILGAVNPIRLDNLIYGGISDNSTVSVTDLNNIVFIVELIERLKSSLFSDQLSESETANYALQVVVKNYGVYRRPDIVGKLSDAAKRACDMCKNTNYSMIKKTLPDTSLSVYEKFKSDNQYSYRDWLDKFSLNLISCISDKDVQEVLHACSYTFKHNLKLAEYLIPHIIIYIVISQPNRIDVIKREVMAILDEDVGVSTQDLDTVYSEDVRGSLQTLHFQCANMVFCALDAIYRLECGIRSLKPPVNLGSSQVRRIKEFNDSIPKDKLAMLATKCRSHARALCYFEQFLFQNKSQLDKYATALQRIYVALDDTYEAAGIEMIRTTPTTIIDDVANYEACGRFDKAFVCCVASFDAMGSDIEREPHIEDSLRCLSNQGDYQRLYEKSRQLINDYSQYKRNILPYAIEASWKLGRWDELDSTFKNEQTENLLEFSSVSKGYLLASLNDSRGGISERLKIVRNRLMKPLTIAMMDRSAYFRGYQNLLVLHSIGDFALSLDVIDHDQLDTQKLGENSMGTMRGSLDLKLDSIFDTWNRRNKLVQQSLRSLEPLLEWQRSICLILSKKYPFLSEKINIDVGRRWLISADSARESRSFDRGFFCLTQAQRWFGSEFDKLSLDLRVRYHIEQAKLNWDQGEQTRAIRSLKLSLDRLKSHDLYKHLSSRQETRSKNTDLFPLLNNMQVCQECCAIDQSERESFAELKMLLTHYCEDACACIPETLFYMYEECVHLGVNQEETYFRLARYYDKLLAYYMENPKLCLEQAEERNQFDASQRFSQNLMSGDKDDIYTKLMEHSIVAFGNSLKYGARYLTESMPRLLNIWYDLGSNKSKLPRPITSRIETTVRFIDELKNKCLPPYYFMSAISILLSRVSHPHSGVSKKTCEILELLLLNYPHQITWLMIALLNDKDNLDRSRAAKQILHSSNKRKNPGLEKIVNDTVKFAELIVELSKRHGPEDNTDEGKEKDKVKDKVKKKKLPNGFVNITEITQNAAKFDFDSVKVMAPCQDSMRAILPIGNSCDDLKKHVVFPERNISYIRKLAPTARIFNSLQQPRQITLQCDNGQSISILCKAGDDLRKDSRCIEFLNLLNRILRRDSQSNARFFEIQTFLVLPLESVAGIIEMVPNCDSLKNVIEPLYKEKNSKFAISIPAPKKNTREYTANELHDVFKTEVLPKYMPPVLPTWFLRKFTEPTSWYMARLAYTRTSAVISMGGYIIGLGDRHLDNILIDTCNGRIIHVDFNLLFHQGENLPTPERVPFRLTHNIIAAFGSMGVEGNYRKVCEITMRVMRKERDALLTTLKPFMHDPCSEWVKVRDTRGNRLDHEDKHGENKTAKFRIEVTERKLKGYPRSKKFKPLTLIDSYSVEAQVDNLIEEASDTFNLALMYFGWCPHV